MAKLHIDFEWWRDRAGYRSGPTEVSAGVVYGAPRHRPLPRDLPPLPGQWGLAYHPLGIRVLLSPDAGRPKPLYVRRCGGALDPYRPLEAFESLFAMFAKLRTPDDVLHFVEK